MSQTKYISQKEYLVQNQKRNRVGWIILAVLCLGIGVMLGGRGATFMSMAQRGNLPQPVAPQLSGQPNLPGVGQAPSLPNQPGMGQAPAQPNVPGIGQAPGLPDQPGERGPRSPRDHGPMMQHGERGMPGNMHGPGRGMFLMGILGLIGQLLKIAVLALAGLLLLRLWRERNDPNDTRRWPWQRRQAPAPGTTDPPFTGDTSSL